MIHDWLSLGTLDGDPMYEYLSDGYGWERRIQTSGGASFQVTFTDVDPRAAWLLLGVPSFRRPRMKHRALRRRLGYTRSGRKR